MLLRAFSKPALELYGVLMSMRWTACLCLLRTSRSTRSDVPDPGYDCSVRISSFLLRIGDCNFNGGENSVVLFLECGGVVRAAIKDVFLQFAFLFSLWYFTCSLMAGSSFRRALWIKRILATLFWSENIHFDNARHLLTTSGTYTCGSHAVNFAWTKYATTIWSALWFL